MPMRKPSRRPAIKELSPEQRSLFAEILKERIYATLTLLAVMVTLWQHPEDHRPLGVIGIIAGTVVALWLATLIAARMSYRAVHHSGDLEPKYREAVEAARGLLMPVGVPIFFVLLALVHIINLQTALMLGVISLVLSLFAFSVYSGRRSADSFGRILLYSFLQMALGVGVTLLKLAVE